MSIPVFCALLLTAAAAYDDLRKQRISNLLVMGGWIAGAGLWMGFRGFRGLPVWLLGMVCTGAAGLIVWKLGGIGAGDVKLLSALGGILSWKRGLWVFFAAGVAAAVWGIALLWRRGQLAGLGSRLYRAVQGLWRSVSMEPLASETHICFAVMLFWGVVLRAVREWWWLH